MGYGRLGCKSSEPDSITSISTHQSTKPLYLKLLIILSIVLILVAAGSVAAIYGIRNRDLSGSGSTRFKPTVAIKRTQGRSRMCKWGCQNICTSNIFLWGVPNLHLKRNCTKKKLRHLGFLKLWGVRVPDRPHLASPERTCGKTRYPDICVESLVAFPGALSAAEDDLVHISVNMTFQRFGRALSQAMDLINLEMDSYTRSAYADCLELLQDSVDHLYRSLSSFTDSQNGDLVDSVAPGSTDDVMTWLGATLTNQDTCTEGLGDVSGHINEQMNEKLRNLWELASVSLAIYTENFGDNEISGIPIQNKRRKLMRSNHVTPLKRNGHFRGLSKEHTKFPTWLSVRDRVLMDFPPAAVQADIVVAKDGSGNYKTIVEAIKKAPNKSKRRIVIYIKAGKYEEDHLKVERKKTNLMFIDDGVGKTVITGHKSVVTDKLTTFHTASFAATGKGFIAHDITFENYAGPSKHQAVALRVGADHSVHGFRVF